MKEETNLNSQVFPEKHYTNKYVLRVDLFEFTSSKETPRYFSVDDCLFSGLIPLPFWLNYCDASQGYAFPAPLPPPNL